MHDTAPNIHSHKNAGRKRINKDYKHNTVTIVI